MKVATRQFLSHIVRHRTQPKSYRMVEVDCIEQRSMIEKKNDGVVRVLPRTDDVDEDLNENDDVKEKGRFERNYNHDEKQLVCRYLIAKSSGWLNFEGESLRVAASP